MGFPFNGAVRRLKTCVGGLAVLTLMAGFGAVPDTATAQTQISYATNPLVVTNDRGGLLRKRLREISQLRKQSRPVEIRGAVCFSTCTMFLGLQNTCISPNTTFGFHGPSSFGRALDPVTFNRASEIIASHYPAQLEQWYMEKGRFKIRSIYRIKGRNLIDMGIRAC